MEVVSVIFVSFVISLGGIGLGYVLASLVSEVMEMGFFFVRKKTYERERRDRLAWQQEAARLSHDLDEAMWNEERMRAAMLTIQRQANDALPNESVLED